MSGDCATTCQYSFDLSVNGQSTIATALEGYIGLDSFDIFYQSEFDARGGPWYNVSDNDITLNTMGIEVTYDYTPVPEPSTAVLVALGMVGLHLMRRGR